MHGLSTVKVQCPYCWETFETVVDCSVNEQNYVEDCYVCCRPILMTIAVHADETVEVEVQAENQ